MCLSFVEIEALIEGSTILGLPRLFLTPGRKFLLYPVKELNLECYQEECYQENAINLLTTNTNSNNISNQNSQVISIKAWAECQQCQVIQTQEELPKISSYTVYSTKGLEQILQRYSQIFVAYLRVYLLSQPVEEFHPQAQEKLGKFIGISKAININQTIPIFNNISFEKLKKTIENREPKKHPELEKLLSDLAKIPHLAAQQIQADIKDILGWRSHKPVEKLTWINEIAARGNPTKDNSKSNYEVGTSFEDIVRKSLEFIGFKIDESHKGGAGGLDLFCSQPYPLVGECKAGKKIPNATAVQLLNLATLRLKDETIISQIAKIIIGPGKPTSQLIDAAKVHNMAIIKPETLEKLVQLQANYPNSIDLFRLKEFLKAGKSDEEIEAYIQEVYQQIKIRSQIVNLVKNYLEKSNLESVRIEGLYGAYINSEFSKQLNKETIYQILIELSSPLAGYLGRKKGKNWENDQFYFLRELSSN